MTTVLLSGGKDSTYALPARSEYGRTLAFTLDNGFISPDALKTLKKRNDLGLI